MNENACGAASYDAAPQARCQMIAAFSKKCRTSFMIKRFNGVVNR